MPLGLGVADQEGTLLTYNAALLAPGGYTPEDIQQLRSVTNLYADAAEREEVIADVTEHGSLWRREVRFKRKDGTVYDALLSLTPIRFEHRPCWLAMVEDITEQKRAAEERQQLEGQLRQAQKMEAIGQLTGGIGHDFNNILTVVLGNAEIVGADLPADRPQLRKDVDEIVHAARRGADMVRKLLGFSRRGDLKLAPLDLRAEVETTMQLLRRLLPTNIELVVQGDEGEAAVLADATAVEQMLMNLATNARDAMPDGGTLHVEVRRTRLLEVDRPLHAWAEPGPYVCVAISDTGVGMDAETVARVFEPFFSTKAAGVGTGLGMAMVYGLVKQHRGFVHLYSEPDQGTTVKIYLPRGKDERVARPSGEQEGLQGGTETLLLAEDDAPVREAARRLFEMVGYTVLVAEDGQAGLDRYRTYDAAVDLVIADVMMPRLNGLGLYDALRRENPDVKVLFVSGYPARQFRQRIARDPGVAFLTKPWTALELLERVRSLLGEAKAPSVE